MSTSNVTPTKTTTSNSNEMSLESASSSSSSTSNPAPAPAASSGTNSTVTPSAAAAKQIKEVNDQVSAAQLMDNIGAKVAIAKSLESLISLETKDNSKYTTLLTWHPLVAWIGLYPYGALSNLVKCGISLQGAIAAADLYATKTKSGGCTTREVCLFQSLVETESVSVDELYSYYNLADAHYKYTDAEMIQIIRTPKPVTASASWSQRLRAFRQKVVKPTLISDASASQEPSAPNKRQRPADFIIDLQSELSQFQISQIELKRKHKAQLEDLTQKYNDTITQLNQAKLELHNVQQEYGILIIQNAKLKQQRDDATRKLKLVSRPTALGDVE